MVIDDWWEPQRIALGVSETTAQRICCFVNPVLEISQCLHIYYLAKILEIMWFGKCITVTLD